VVIAIPVAVQGVSRVGTYRKSARQQHGGRAGNFMFRYLLTYTALFSIPAHGPPPMHSRVSLCPRSPEANQVPRST
jgi:hypothetical protein